MAATMARCVEVATELENICNDLANVFGRISDFIPLNQALNVDWGASGSPITTDASSNLTGKNYSPAQVSNAIGTIAAIQSLLTANGNAHLGNIDLIRSATVR